MKLVLRELNRSQFEADYLGVINRNKNAFLTIESLIPIQTVDARSMKPKFRQGETVVYEGERRVIKLVSVEGMKYIYQLYGDSKVWIKEDGLAKIKTLLKEYTNEHREQLGEFAEAAKNGVRHCSQMPAKCTNCIFDGKNSSPETSGCSNPKNTVKGGSWDYTGMFKEEFFTSLIRDLGPTKEDIEQASEYMHGAMKIMKGHGVTLATANWDSVEETDLKSDRRSLIKNYTNKHKEQIKALLDNIGNGGRVCQNVVSITCEGCVFSGDNAAKISVAGCANDKGLKTESWRGMDKRGGVQAIEEFLTGVLRDLGPTDEEKIENKKQEEVVMKKSKEFRDGDRVWSTRSGWGTVEGRGDDYFGDFPVRVEFDDGSRIDFTSDGKEYTVDKLQSLFFEEIVVPESALYKNAWRAERDDDYYYIGSIGRVEKDREVGFGCDDDRYAVGNYFRTEEEAKGSQIYKAFNGGM
ncbi:MAG: hypothetical protein ACRDDH_11775 [Cetobacterium sp.]|uniref:hypothetical protein n=1 Tax=Cetobacterium sp. TaxID=2071632 RepID=UPI003EE756D3